MCDEATFSNEDCGICGSRWAGDRHVWHGVDDKGDIVHSDDACTDCVLRLAGYTEDEIKEGR